jgi:hypothetical protein
MNFDQESAIYMLDPIEDQTLSWQNSLRMARGRYHCKLSLRQYDIEVFWAILTLP